MARPATDLTAATGLTALSGTPVAQVAAATLAAGAALVAEWRELEPIVKQLIRRVRYTVEHEHIKDAEALHALAMTATVVAKVGAASTGILRASEGMSKLALLLDAGRVRRSHPGELTEKQLAAVVLETAKKIVDRTGRCPLCQPVEASAKVTENAEAS